VESGLVDMRTNALPLLEAYGVDLVLSGHSHSYERSALIDGHYGLSTTFDTRMVRDNRLGDATQGPGYTKPSLSGGSHEGAVYVVAGSSGKISGGSLDHPVMLTNLNVLGSVVLDIDGSTLTARFVDDAGNVLDRFDIERGVTSILELYADDTPVEGEVATLHSYAEDPDGNEVVSYTWDFADGTPTVTGPDQVHVWADDGVVPVTVTVVDLAGDTVSRTLDLPVLNLPPQIVDYGNDPAQQGIPTRFWATATDVPTDTITYSWDFGDGSTVFGDEVDHLFLADGTYTVTVTASDEDGGSSSASLEVLVSGTPPDAQTIYVSPASEGSPVALSAGNDPDVVSWSWDLHDGLPVRLGQSITHTWADDGGYPVTLTTTDAEGDADVRQITVQVANVAPTDLQVSAVDYAVEGDLLTFVGSADDPGDDLLSYLWSFGDGSPVVTGASVQHRYGTEGTYSVSLAVSDGDGGVSSLLTSVDVVNAPPTAASLVLPSSVTEGQLASFAVVPDDPGDDTVSVRWALGDGAESELTELQHAYADEGVYSVLLTLDDGDGGLLSVPHQVSVSNVPPTLEGQPATSVVLGGTFRFTPTVVDPGTADTHSFELVGPPGATVGPSGGITWVPDRVQTGVSFVLTADDGTDRTTRAFTVDVLPITGDGSATDLLGEERGCGCTSNPGPVGWFGLLGVVGLVGRLRGRARPAPRR
jgi:PKD repeat protein